MRGGQVRLGPGAKATLRATGASVAQGRGQGDAAALSILQIVIIAGILLILRGLRTKQNPDSAATAGTDQHAIPLQCAGL